MLKNYLKLARAIVAAHRAEYTGVYYMGGGGGGGKGGLGTIIQAVSDVAAAATGNAEFIPLINAGETTATDVASGQSIGKSLGRGALAGGEALAGQEALGAVGIGSGNSFVNNEFGIPDSPSALGLPDIGGGISNAFTSATNALGLTSPAPPSLPLDASAGVGGTGAPTSTPSAGAGAGGAGGGAAATAAPVTPDQSLSAASNAAGNVASSANQVAGDIGSQVGGSAGAGGTTSVPASSVGQSFPGTSVPGEVTTGATGGSTASQPSVLPGSPSGGGTPNIGAAFNPQSISSTSASGPPAGIQGGDIVSNPTPSLGSSLSSGISKAFDKNPLGILASGGGLALDALKGNQAVKGENQVNQIAGQEMAQGQSLQKYLASGTLPPGLQAAVTQATSSAKAAIRSRYAAMGQSGSSAEQEDLAAVDQNAASSAGQMAMQLLQTGISETGAASSLYEHIMGSALQQDQELGQAIGNFSTALAGGTPQERKTSSTTTG